MKRRGRRSVPTYNVLVQAHGSLIVFIQSGKRNVMLSGEEKRGGISNRSDFQQTGGVKIGKRKSGKINRAGGISGVR